MYNKKHISRAVLYKLQQEEEWSNLYHETNFSQKLHYQFYFYFFTGSFM